MTRWYHLVLGLAVLASSVVSAGAAPDVAAELDRLPAIRGAPPAAADLEGRVLLVVFFASWCPPCQEEFPHLNTVQEAYQERGLQVVAVNVFEQFEGLSTPERLSLFLDETGPVFPILKGDRAIRQAFFGLDRIPTVFVFARDGRLAMIFKHERGATKTHLTEAELRAAVEPLL